MRTLYVHIALLLFTCGAVVAADVTMEYMTTKAEGSSVAVEWVCNTERSVARYEVERSTDGQNFRSLGIVDAKGPFNVYRFVDADVLLKGGETQQRVNGRAYFYRIKILGTDNTVSYSSVSSVVYNVSSVRRTWGMIKEMFK